MDIFPQIIIYIFITFETRATETKKWNLEKKKRIAELVASTKFKFFSESMPQISLKLFFKLYNSNFYRVCFLLSNFEL